MQPSEIRRQILSDHETLSAMISSIERLSLEVVEGERHLVGALRLEGQTFLERLLEHMYWEDRYLRPALCEADAWGRERAERLDREHAEQRETLTFALATLEDQSRPAVLIARNLLDLVKLLREDMRDEEDSLLDERVLRDDVIAIDAEGG